MIAALFACALALPTAVNGEVAPTSREIGIGTEPIVVAPSVGGVAYILLPDKKIDSLFSIAFGEHCNIGSAFTTHDPNIRPVIDPYDRTWSAIPGNPVTNSCSELAHGRVQPRSSHVYGLLSERFNENSMISVPGHENTRGDVSERPYYLGSSLFRASTSFRIDIDDSCYQITNHGNAIETWLAGCQFGSIRSTELAEGIASMGLKRPNSRFHHPSQIQARRARIAILLTWVSRRAIARFMEGGVVRELPTLLQASEATSRCARHGDCIDFVRSYFPDNP